MDELNRKVIRALQTNGRKTNSELAREFGVAPSTMLERIRQLEERGVLRGYRALVDPQALGLTIQGFISVILDRHNVDNIRIFEDEIQKIPNVRACYHITGRFDYFLHVAARDLEHLSEIIKDKIASVNGISKVETFLVLSEVKSDGGWPIE